VGSPNDLLWQWAPGFFIWDAPDVTIPGMTTDPETRADSFSTLRMISERLNLRI
jgi:hypothetical protein